MCSLSIAHELQEALVPEALAQQWQNIWTSSQFRQSEAQQLLKLWQSFPPTTQRFLVESFEQHQHQMLVASYSKAGEYFASLLSLQTYLNRRMLAKPLVVMFVAIQSAFADEQDQNQFQQFLITQLNPTLIKCRAFIQDFTLENQNQVMYSFMTSWQYELTELVDWYHELPLDQRQIVSGFLNLLSQEQIDSWLVLLHLISLSEDRMQSINLGMVSRPTKNFLPRLVFANGNILKLLLAFTPSGLDAVVKRITIEDEAVDGSGDEPAPLPTGYTISFMIDLILFVETEEFALALLQYADELPVVYLSMLVQTFNPSSTASDVLQENLKILTAILEVIEYPCEFLKVFLSLKADAQFKLTQVFACLEEKVHRETLARMFRTIAPNLANELASRFGEWEAPLLSAIFVLGGRIDKAELQDLVFLLATLARSTCLPLLEATSGLADDLRQNVYQMLLPTRDYEADVIISAIQSEHDELHLRQLVDSMLRIKTSSRILLFTKVLIPEPINASLQILQFLTRSSISRDKFIGFVAKLKDPIARVKFVNVLEEIISSSQSTLLKWLIHIHEDHATPLVLTIEQFDRYTTESLINLIDRAPYSHSVEAGIIMAELAPEQASQFVQICRGMNLTSFYQTVEYLSSLAISDVNLFLQIAYAVADSSSTTNSREIGARIRKLIECIQLVGKHLTPAFLNVLNQVERHLQDHLMQQVREVAGGGEREALLNLVITLENTAVVNFLSCFDFLSAQTINQIVCSTMDMDLMYLHELMALLHASTEASGFILSNLLGKYSLESSCRLVIVLRSKVDPIYHDAFLEFLLHHPQDDGVLLIDCLDEEHDPRQASLFLKILLELTSEYQLEFIHLVARISFYRVNYICLALEKQDGIVALIKLLRNLKEFELRKQLIHALHKCPRQRLMIKILRKLDLNDTAWVLETIATWSDNAREDFSQRYCEWEPMDPKLTSEDMTMFINLIRGYSYRNANTPLQFPDRTIRPSKARTSASAPLQLESHASTSITSESILNLQKRKKRTKTITVKHRLNPLQTPSSGREIATEPRADKQTKQASPEVPASQLPPAQMDLTPPFPESRVQASSTTVPSAALENSAPKVEPVDPQMEMEDIISVKVEQEEVEHSESAQAPPKPIGIVKEGYQLPDSTQHLPTLEREKQFPQVSINLHRSASAPVVGISKARKYRGLCPALKERAQEKGELLDDQTIEQVRDLSKSKYQFKIDYERSRLSFGTTSEAMEKIQRARVNRIMGCRLKSTRVPSLSRSLGQTYQRATTAIAKAALDRSGLSSYRYSLTRPASMNDRR